MRYVVTGAAGFIGSHLADALLGRGHEVVAVDSFTDYYDPALKEENAAGLDVQRLDLAEAELDLAGVDAIFHLAGQPGARSFGPVFADYLSRNALATQRLFESAGSTKVVYASSSSIYGAAERYPTPEETEPRPNSPYGITKLASEHLAAAYGRAYGLDAVGLRYFTVYGPRQRPDMAFARLVDAIAHKGSFEGGRGVAEPPAAALNALGGTVSTVGGGGEASLREAIGLLEEIAGRPLEVSYGPP